jgi:UDP-N-acetylglucosamine 1-carboxyvinyltransferase
MGADIKVTEGFIEACAPSGVHGAIIHMQTPSVTGTMNLMMAACLASGVTYIYNPAREPEVTDLANCLINMGAMIQGAGTDRIIIHGRDKLLNPYKYTVMEDRIEAGTFLILGAMAGNPLAVCNCTSEYQTALLERLREIGAQIDINERSITVRKASCPVAVDIQTGPYPAYPTDLQPQLMALLSLAQGTSRITETIFEERFNQAAELIAMGANIGLDGQDAVISGVSELSGGMVAATDLRAGASLVIAAIAAKGLTVISGTHYIERGYYELPSKLRKIGVKVKRIRSFDEKKRKEETAQTTVPTLCSKC